MVSKNLPHYKYWKKKPMFFHSIQFRLPNKPQVVFNNTEIAFKPDVRFLGIYIRVNLKWNVHVHWLWYDMIWYMIWWYMIWYNIIYDMIWYDMIKHL
jgi:hypothetical protein